MSEAEKTGTWRLAVDADRCQGHNRCHALAPDLFRIDELGFASVIREEVAPELLEKAKLAVRNCPEFAIRLSRGGSQGDEA
jgi:ferredoxin